MATPDGFPKFDPDWTLHPGVALREWLSYNRCPPFMFAKAAGIDREVMERLFAGDPAERVTDVLAHRIHHGPTVLGVGPSPQFWINYEATYREALARGKTDVTLDNMEGMPMASAGAELIALERERQKVKGFDDDHDAGHTHGELVRAGISFAWAALGQSLKADQNWPFLQPRDAEGQPYQDLVRAGAMIAAELDRLIMLEP